MTEQIFSAKCKEIVVDYFNTHKEETNKNTITKENVFIVWESKILQNNKATLSTTLFDGMYYEITYNGDKNEFYLDVYKKCENVCIKGE